MENIDFAVEVESFYELHWCNTRWLLVSYSLSALLNRYFLHFFTINISFFFLGSQAKGYLQFPQDFRKPIILQNPIYQRNWWHDWWLHSDLIKLNLFVCVCLFYLFIWTTNFLRDRQDNIFRPFDIGEIILIQSNKKSLL